MRKDDVHSPLPLGSREPPLKPDLKVRVKARVRVAVEVLRVPWPLDGGLSILDDDDKLSGVRRLVTASKVVHALVVRLDGLLALVQESGGVGKVHVQAVGRGERRVGQSGEQVRGKRVVI
jgi:hypothetical protein